MDAVGETGAQPAGLEEAIPTVVVAKICAIFELPATDDKDVFVVASTAVVGC